MKKLLSIFLAACLCLGALSAAAAGYTDVQDSSFGEAISVLTKLCVVAGDGDGTFRPEDPISRSEFTACVIRILGLENVARSLPGEQLFSDVPEDRWDIGYVTLACHLSLVQGNGDGTFEGESTVTLAQASKILVSALGYGLAAEEGGGYPAGYLLQGQRHSLLLGLGTAGAETPLTRGQTAQMLYNALEEPVLELDSNGNILKEGQTFLSDRLGVEKKYGVVTANAFTSLYEADWSAKEGQIQIENRDGDTLTYEADLLEGVALLGQQVDYYCYRDKQSEEQEILWIKAREGSQNIVEIPGADVEPGSTLTAFQYIQNNRLRSLRIAADASVIYNYVYCPREAVTALKPEMGSLRLIDRDRDGAYDVVCIFDYQGFVVDAVKPDAATPHISVRKNAQNQFSVPAVDDGTERTLIIRDGARAELEDLESGDIICVAQSKSPERKVILTGGAQVSGTVSKLREDSGENYITVDGTEYRVSSMLSTVPQAGDEGVFYTAMDSVVYADCHELAGENYAYLLDCARDGGAFQSGYLLKCLTKEGRIVTYDAADRIRVAVGVNDPVTYISGSDAFDKFMSQNKKELVILSTNASGQVSRLTFPADNTLIQDYRGYTEDVFTKDKSGKMYYRSIEPPTLGGEYMLTKDTLVFDVKSLTPGGEPVEEEDYYAGDYSVFGNDRSYIVDIYDSSPNLKAAAVVIREDVSTEEIVPYNSPCFLVEGLERGIDQDGLETILLSGLYEGERISVPLEDELVEDVETDKKLVDVMEQGAVIQIKKNMRQELEAARILYLPSDDSFKRELVWSGSGSKVDLYTTYGMVRYLESDVLSISTDGGVTAKPFAVGNAKIYRVDSRRDQIGPAELDDITAARSDLEGASCVFLRTYRNAIGEIIIFD